MTNASNNPPQGTASAKRSARTSWTYWFFERPEFSGETTSNAVRVGNLIAAFLLAGTVVVVPLLLLDVQWNWTAIWTFREKFITGFLLTLEISAASLCLSLLAGLVSALVGRWRFLPSRYINRIYVDLVRCTPMVVQILFFFYVTAPAMGITDRTLAGIMILSFSYGAYISEIIRSAIDSVGRAQWDASRAIGLSTAQTYRYIILPQTVRQALPPLAGQLMSLIKDSSLLSIISVGEFTKNAMETSNITYSSLECYTVLGAGYLLLTMPIAFFTRALEIRASFDK